MNLSFLNIAIFASVTLGIFGAAGIVFDLLLKSRLRIDERMKSAFRDRAHERAKQSPLFPDLQSFAEGEEFRQPPLAMRLQTMMAQAGLVWEVKHLMMLMSAIGMAVFAVLYLFIRNWMIVLPFAGASSLTPLIYVHVARKKRMFKLCHQLPEAFDAMSRSMRAGQTVTSAFQMVANDFPMPISEEFATCYEQQHLGISYEMALRDLARRTGFVETQIFATAMIVNRQVGGNLADLLGRLAITLRKRRYFQARVRALTGEGRMQAVVLIALPIVAFLSLALLNPSYAQVLIDRPKLIALTAMSQIVGAVCIQRIINFKF